MTESESHLTQEEDSWILKIDETLEPPLSHPLWVNNTWQKLEDKQVKKLTINLARAGHIDSQGLRHLLALNELFKEKNIQLRLLNPSRQLNRLLQIMQLHRILTIEFDEEQQ